MDPVVLQDKTTTTITPIVLLFSLPYSLGALHLRLAVAALAPGFQCKPSTAGARSVQRTFGLGVILIYN